MTKSEIYIKAIHQWVVRYGMEEMPEDVVEWYDEEIGSTDPDCVVEYSDADVHDELGELDSYNNKESYEEDSENSQALALELMGERNG
jgi:hypothetical protein